MSEDLHIIDIPAERSPEFTRQDFLRPPDWRYQAAVAYLDDIEAGRSPQIPTDACVQYAIRAIKAFRHPGSRELVRQCWDSIYKVLYLGTVASDSAITAEVESLLIHGADVDDPEVKVLPFSTDVYRLYAMLFFDLSGVIAIHTWMHDYLFGPQHVRGSFNTKLRTRLLAYYGGRTASQSSGVLGAVPPDALALMKTMMSNERQRKLFEYMMHKLKLNDTDYAMLMEAAVKDMTTREFQEHMKDREEAGSDTIESVADGLETAIRAFTQPELSDVDKNGLDFDNRYIKHILRKDNGTEDSTGRGA